MDRLKKYCIISALCMASFCFQVLAAVEVSKETPFEELVVPSDFSSRLVKFWEFLKDLQLNGLFDGEVLVAREGHILLALRSQDIVSHKEPQFMIGSVSKQFISVALLKALYDSSSFGTEELRISDVKRKLHLPISQFLPDNSTIWDGNMPVWANEISLHHLLTHTSGVPNYTASDTFMKPNSNDQNKRWYESYHSPNELINIIRKEELLFSKGTKFSYSNTGYVIIAEVIESITSMSVSGYLQEALFDPVGLSSTTNAVHGQWDVLRREKLPSLAAPFKYDLKGNQLDLFPLIHCEDMSVTKGAGSIISTSNDLLKWNQSLHKNQSLLPKDLYDLLITPNRDGYGYGIGIQEKDTGVLLRHNGGIGSYRSLLLYIPEQDVSMIVLSNICYGFDKLEDEFKETVESLKNTISDENERNQSALKMILEKYPNIRGFEKIVETIENLFL